MSDREKTYRVSQLVKVLNVGVDTIRDYCEQHQLASIRTPNEKIPASVVLKLLEHFAGGKIPPGFEDLVADTGSKEKHEQSTLVKAPQKENIAPSVSQVKEEKSESKAEGTGIPLTEEVPIQLKIKGKVDLGKKKLKKESTLPSFQVEEKVQVEPKEEKGSVLDSTIANETSVTPEVVTEKTTPLQFEEEKTKEDSADAKASGTKQKEISVSREIEEQRNEVETTEEKTSQEIITAKAHTPVLEGPKIVGRLPEELLYKEKRIKSKKTREIKEKEREKEIEEKPQYQEDLLEKSEALKNWTQELIGERKRPKEKKRKRIKVSRYELMREKPVGLEKIKKPKGEQKLKKRPRLTQESVEEKLSETLAKQQEKGKKARQRLRKERKEEKARKKQLLQGIGEHENVLEVAEFLSVAELADLMNVPPTQIIMKCMQLGYMVTINYRLEKELIELIAEEFGYKVKFATVEEAIAHEIEEEEDESQLQPRPPIVTVMGHVDHGKTSLLDYIRNTNIVAGEAGGITQHIGAYEVELPEGKRITFIDTPGHEAFTAMRARGAKVTDIALIVIAADDQVMPQTKEAIQHAEAAGVSMIFVINKIDKPEAKPDRVREQLAKMNYLVEDWGGPYQCQEVSAKTGQGIPELLEKILVEAELMELKANPNRPAEGVVLEAKLDPGRGPVATLLIQNGTLRKGDVILANQYYGRVKAMFDERGKPKEEAPPSTPVQVLGLNGVPEAGDKFVVMPSEREAREIANKREQILREQRFRIRRIHTLEELSKRSAEGNLKELPLIIKADTQGSEEALIDALYKLSTDEVEVKVVMHGVGQITESDVSLAAASQAIIIGFNVRPNLGARRAAEKEGVEIRNYKIIYDVINDVKQTIEGMLKPVIKEEVVGIAEVRKVFKIKKVGTVAGCYVEEGKIVRNLPVRLIRDGVDVYSGKIASLKRFQEDVKEVQKGYECGILLEGYNDIKEGDIIECFQEVEIKRTLEEISSTS